MSIKIAIIAHALRSGGGLVQTMNLLRALADVAGDERFLLIYSQGYGYEQLKLPAGTDVYVYTAPAIRA